MTSALFFADVGLIIASLFIVQHSVEAANITSPALSYSPHEVFLPGYIDFDLSVATGAPCSATCAFQGKGAAAIIPAQIITIPILHDLRTYQGNVLLQNAGEYHISCDFHSSDRTINAQMNIIVSEENDGISLIVNSDIAVGSMLISRFDFDASPFKYATKVVVQAYYNAAQRGREYILGQYYSTTRNDVTRGFSLAHIMSTIGMKYLRFRLYITPIRGGEKIVEKVATVTVKSVVLPRAIILRNNPSGKTAPTNLAGAIIHKLYSSLVTPTSFLVAIYHNDVKLKEENLHTTVNVKCNQTAGKSFEFILRSWSSPSLPVDHDKISAYCIFAFDYQFPHFGLYRIVARAVIENNIIEAEETICVTKFQSCSTASVKISGASADGIITFTEGEDVFVAGEYTRVNCPDYKRISPPNSIIKWTVSRFADGIDKIDHSSPIDNTWRPVITNGKELSLSAASLMLGFFQAVFQVSNSKYCGQDPFLVSDRIILKIVRPHLRAKIEGGAESFLHISASSRIHLKSELQYPGRAVSYRWYCRTEEEENQFSTFYQGKKNTIGAAHRGCFGNGFLVQPNQGGTEAIDIFFSQLIDDANLYRIRLSVSDRYSEAYDDHAIVLKMASNHVLRTIHSLQKISGVNPRVTIKCLENCKEAYVASNVLHLQASCENCVEDLSNLPFKLLYKWRIEKPDSAPDHLENFNWEEASYSANGGEPDLRFKPFAFTNPGKYKITTMMEAEYRVTKDIHSLGAARHDVYVIDKPVPLSCFIRPPSGLALLTKFEISCSKDPLKDLSFYQMFYSSCHSCNERDSFSLFYQGYGHSIKDVVLRTGEEGFGYKLVIRIRIFEKSGVFGDSYINVRVIPQKNLEFNVISPLIEDFSALDGNDVVKLSQLATALLSVTEYLQDESFSYNVVNSVILKVKKVKPTYHEAAKLLAKVTKETLSVISRNIKQFPDKVLTLLHAVDKATSLQTEYLAAAGKNNSDSSKLEDVGNYVISSIAHGMRLTANQTTASNFLALTTSFSKKLNAISLVFADAKPAGEKRSEVSVEGFRASVKNTRMERGQTATFFSLQSGLTITRLNSVDNSVDWNIQSSISTLPFNPLPNKVTGRSGATFNQLSVLGISLSVKDMGKSEIQNISSFMEKRTIRALVPLSEKNFALTETIRLPQPCPNQNSTQTSASVASVAEPCGSVLASLNFAAASGNQEILKDSTFVVIRPRRPCRVLNKPCVKVSFLLRVSSNDNTTGRTVKLESGECSQYETQLKLLKCFKLYQVLLAETLPRSTNTERSSVFDSDPWAIPVSSELFQAVSLKLNVSTVIEYVQNDYLSIYEDADSYQSVDISLLKTTCMIWDEVNREWTDEVCKVQGLSKQYTIDCQCGPQRAMRRDLTSLRVRSSKEPLYFAADAVIIPKTTDFKDIVKLFLETRLNYLILAVVLVSWALFIIALVWARRADKKESSTAGIVVCPDNNAEDCYLYEVVITTGLLRGSGTTANVTIALEGNNGIKSSSHVISTKDHGTFQRSSRDSFLIATPKCLGNVQKIRLGHDNSGENPSWHVNRVAVFDLHDKNRHPSYFLVNSWLSHDIFPYRCRITIEKTKTEQLLSFKTRWKIYLAHLLSTTDVWLSLFFRSASSPYNRAQRLACMACAYFGTMLVTNILMNTSSVHYMVKIGFVQINLSPVIIALQSCIIIAPLSFLHATVFNRIETSKERDLMEAMEKLYKKTSATLIKTCSAEVVRSDLNVGVIPSQMSPVKHCVVEELDSKSIRDFTGYQSYDDEDDGDDDDDDDDDDDFIATLQEQCQKARLIAERIARESKRLGSPANRNIKVRVFDSLIETKKHALPLMQSQVFHNTGNYSAGQFHNTEDLHPGRIWYKRFKAKRLLRRQRELAKDLEMGKKTSKSTLSVHSLDDPHKGDAGLISVLARRGNELDEYVLLLRDIVYLPKTTGVLPSWSSNLVWAVTWLWMLCCSVLSLIYGLGYDKPKFTSWLVLFIFALFQDILIISALRLHAAVAFCTFANAKEVDVEQWAAYTGPAMRAEAVLKWRKLRHTLATRREVGNVITGESRRTSFSESPTLRLIRSGKRSLAVRQVQRYWLETIAWLCIAVFVTMLIIYQRDHRLARITNRLREAFRDELEAVKIKESVFFFLEEAVIPLFFERREYSPNDQTKPLGTIRLRQLRVTADKRCSCNDRISVLVGCNCLASADGDKFYDKANYSAFWKKSKGGSSDLLSPWHYSSTHEGADATNFQFGSSLRRSTYPNGGYIADLGFSLDQAYSATMNLFYSRWFDKKSAAVIAEFSILEKVTGYVTVNLFCFEFLATGEVSTFYQSHSYRPIYIYKPRDIVIIGLQLFHFTISLYLLYRIFAEFAKAKWNLLSIITICTDIWNILEVSAIFVTFAAYGYFIQHAITAAEASDALRKDASRFVSFSKAAYCSTMYWNLISFSAFLCYIRLLKAMRGSRCVSVMVDTLTAASEGIASVAFLVVGVTIGFSVSGVWSFSSNRWNFRRLLTATTSLTSLAAGMEMPQPEHGVTQNIWWSIYFILFGLFTLAFYVNLYSTIMSDALFFIQNEATKETAHRVETLAAHWMYEKTAGFFGIKSKAFSGKKIKLREPPGLLLHGSFAEEMKKSLTLDPIDGPLDESSIRAHGRSDNIWNRRCSRRLKV